MHIPINPPIEIKVTYQRHDIKLFTIIHTNQHGIIFPIIHLIGDFKNKCPIATPMLSYLFAVDENIAYTVCSFKTEKQSFAFLYIFLFQTMCFAFVSISKEPVSRRPKQDTARAYSLVWDCRGLREGAKGAL